MTRVAYVCADPGVPVFGSKGCSVHVQEVLRAMLRAGAEVDLFTVRLGGDTPSGLPGLRVHPIELSGSTDVLERERSCVAAGERIAEQLTARGPEYDLVYERYSLWSAAGMEFSKARQIPGVLEVNAPLIEEQAAHRDLVDLETAVRMTRRAFESASLLCPVSRPLAEYLERCGVESRRVRVVANGVDPGRFPLRARGRRLPGDGFVVGFVGTLKPWHDLVTLAFAFRELHDRHRDARLIVVGDGPERELLEGDLARWGLADAVEFTGKVRPDAVPQWLARFDVGVAPYSAKQPCYFSPLKILEYMAAGLPTVASRVGDMPEIVADGQTGLLCEPDDADALLEKLLELHGSPELRATLGARAREQVERRHSWSRVVGFVLREAGLDSFARRVEAA